MCDVQHDSDVNVKIIAHPGRIFRAQAPPLEGSFPGRLVSPTVSVLPVYSAFTRRFPITCSCPAQIPGCSFCTDCTALAPSFSKTLYWRFSLFIWTDGMVSYTGCTDSRIALIYVDSDCSMASSSAAKFCVLDSLRISGFLETLCALHP